MYQVYCDEALIYDTRIESLKLVNPKLDLELNKTGSFTFTIYPSHPHYGQLRKLKSIIRVYSNDYLIFRGRILNDDQGFHNEKAVTCEGELAFLLDTIQRPYDFQGSPRELFERLITAHNEQVEETKRFIVGEVTVTDPNDYIHRSDSLYGTTWSDLNGKLIDTLGGYLWVRHEPDGNYIDYLADFDALSTQEITFGENLLDLSSVTKGEGIATAIIPLGAKSEETEARLTIASVNDGLDYVYDAEAVARYGWIFKVVEWDDVTLPENLLAKAKAYLAEAIKLSASIELDAIDLSAANADISTFRLGTYIKVSTAPHGLDALMLVRKLSIYLDSPSRNKLTLGASYSTLSEQVNGVEKAQASVVTQMGAVTGLAKLIDVRGTGKGIEFGGISTEDCFGVSMTAKFRKDVSVAGALRASNIRSGSDTITPTAANTVTSKTITFDAPLAEAPNVLVTPKTANPAAVRLSVDNVTAKGFTVHLTRTDATETGIFWLAIT